MFVKMIGHEERNAVQNTVLLFFPVSRFSIFEERNDDNRTLTVTLENQVATAVLTDNGNTYTSVSSVSGEGDTVACAVSRSVFDVCRQATGITPPWGVLTGIRPVKKVQALEEAFGNRDAAEEALQKYYLATPLKIRLAQEVSGAEKQALAKLNRDAVSLYISIPFCPSRCKYCSFVSQSIEKAEKLLPDYVECLCEELKELARVLKKSGKYVQTAYMGGGTPTTLSALQMDTVLSTVENAFDLSHLEEFTVEAGRPDTVTEEKLAVLKKHHIDRISINPQTMHDSTLERIGRRHTVSQVKKAFAMARNAGFTNINMDLIAGLEGESADDFAETLSEVLALNPDSITVHTLSVKKAAFLAADWKAALSHATDATVMVSLAQEKLMENGYLPYYLYRQKNMVGNLENVGYAKPGKMCLYNVYIMGEYQTIIATGAGGVGKYIDYESDRITRIFNYKYPYEYIERMDKVKENLVALQSLLLGEPCEQFCQFESS